MGITLEVVNGPSIALQVTRISLRSGAGTGTPGADGASNSRDDHGTVSTGSVALSATDSNHTYDTAGDHAWTLPDFSALLPVIHVEINVTSGNPTVTPPASAVIASDSPQTLTDMPTGKKLVKIESFDDGVSHLVTVENAGASPTSSITTPIYIDDSIPLVFSEAQNPATVLTFGTGVGDVELFDVTAGSYVPASISSSDNVTWTFVPTSSLTNGNSYEFYLSREITSLVGNRRYNGQNLTFTAANLYEDYTTFTEVDPSAFVTVTSTKLAAAAMTRDISTYIYKDLGAAFFPGDFTHRFEFTHTSGDSNGMIGPWCISNAVGDLVALTAADDFLFCLAVDLTVGAQINVREVVATVTTQAAQILIDTGTKYYCEIERDEAVGANGTLYLRVYTDSAYSVLHDSTSLTLTANLDLRYIYGLNSFNSGNTNSITGDVEKLRIGV